MCNGKMLSSLGCVAVYKYKFIFSGDCKERPQASIDIGKYTVKILFFLRIVFTSIASVVFSPIRIRKHFAFCSMSFLLNLMFSLNTFHFQVANYDIFELCNLIHVLLSKIVNPKSTSQNII